MDPEVAEAVVGRLLLALAEQWSASLLPEAPEAFADLSRAEAQVLFGVAGHLVHYGTETESLGALISVITATQRLEVGGGQTSESGR